MSLIKNEYLVYKGSVKDLYSLNKNELIFNYSDRFSIFDWGQMPDMISNKGMYLAQMGRLFFNYLADKSIWNDNFFLSLPLSVQEHNSMQDIKEKLQKDGLKSHFVKQTNDNGEESFEGPNLVVKSVDVLKPKKVNAHYNYADYQRQLANTLVPLEIIFRLGVPKGSSLLSRKSEVPYIENQEFEIPLIEFSTKLEPIDRLLTEQEACQIAGLSHTEFENLKLLSTLVALKLKELITKMNLTLWDGKFEFAFDKKADDKRDFMLVDSIGIDELRITSETVNLSKEILRQYYLDTNWFKQIKKYKDTYQDEWKKQMIAHDITPPSLDPAFKNLTEKLYQAFCLDLASVLKNKIPDQVSKWTDDYHKYLAQEKINILVLGNGGREHALCWRLLKSESTKHLYITDKHHAMLNDEGINLLPTTPTKTLDFINELKNHHIKLVVIGPEAYLVDGLADFLREHNFLVFGPNQKAAQLESSKDFAKTIMQASNIPTAKHATFYDPKIAMAFIEQSDWSRGHVIKMDTLAAGKGVIVTQNKPEALQAINDLMVKNSLNLPSTKVVIEERLIGKEVSVFALMDQNNVIYLADACDYKRIRDNDEGPNTGGMGTYSPCEWLQDQDRKFIQNEILLPLHRYLIDNEIEYNGVLFVGLMKTDDGFKVLEFNVRFGDPETQSILPRIQGDFAKLLLQCASKQLHEVKQIELASSTCINVVCAAHGYPGTEGVQISTNDEIQIQDHFENNQKIFFAGVKNIDDKLFTNGGRVLSLATWGNNKKEVRSQLYHSLVNIKFQGMQYRHDIGK